MHRWYKATAEATVGNFTRGATGVSNASVEDAQVRATAAARQSALRAARDDDSAQYPYGVRPLAEPVLREWRRPDGSLSGLLTVNARGCVVLNTASVMFVDVDLPQTPKPSRGLFATLLGLKPPPVPPAPDPAPAALAKLHAFVAAFPEWGFRVYRTAAGLRYLCTNALRAPAAPESLAVLAELGSDPLYCRLCEKQECFRARVTPKPWRINLALHRRFHDPREFNRGKFPAALTDPAAPPKSNYEFEAAKFAVCKFIEHIGSTSWHPEAHLFSALHDDFTRPASNLPLA